MERGRIQGLHKFLGYPLLSQERVKLRTSNFVGTFIESIGTKAHENVGNSGRGRSQPVPKIFRAPICRAHCVVIFAIAQLSCLFRWRNIVRCLCCRTLHLSLDHRPVKSSSRLSATLLRAVQDTALCATWCKWKTGQLCWYCIDCYLMHVKDRSVVLHSLNKITYHQLLGTVSGWITWRSTTCMLDLEGNVCPAITLHNITLHKKIFNVS